MPSRVLSGTERAWLVADALCPPFVNQQLIEGTGDLSLPQLRRAVRRAALASPGVCVRLRGRLQGSRWLADGPAPPVSVIETDWDGQGDEGAPFLRRPLDPWRGPTAEVLVLRGVRTRLVVRTHHASCDGRGAGLFTADLFRALRGEAPLGSTAGPLTDAALARELLGSAPPAEQPSSRWRAPTGGTGGDLRLQVAWRRRRVRGSGRGLLPRALRALWRASLQHGEAPLRVGIPVDLRRHRPGVRSAANLTGIAHVELDDRGVEPAALRAAVEAPETAQLALAAEPLRGVPLWLMRAEGRRHARRALRTGQFATSATISNLGRQDLGALSGGGFVAQRSVWIPPGQPSLPLFLTLSGDSEGFDILASAPVGLAGGERQEALLEGMARELSGSAAPSGGGC